MKEFEKIGDIYNKETVENYFKTISDDPKEKNEGGSEKFLSSLIPKSLKDKTVLDLGCGDCRYSEVFCEREAKRVVATDLSSSMLERAKVRKSEKKLNQLELIRADLDDLPIEKNKFDLIFSRFSLMHSGKIEQVIKILESLLSDGGEILTEVSIVANQDEKEKIEIEKAPISFALAINDKEVELKNFPYFEDEYIKAFEDAGLKIEVFEKFPTNDMVIDKSYLNRDKIKFLYGVFKVKKEK